MYLESNSVLKIIFLFLYAAISAYFVSFKLKQSFLLGITIALTILLEFYLTKTIFSFWSILAILIAFFYIKFKFKLIFLSLVLIILALISSKVFIPHFFYLEIIPWRNISSESGVVATINQLRGQESNDFLAKILFNKSLYIYTFLGNILKGFDLTNLSNNLFFANAVFLFIGIYKYFKSFFKKERLPIYWLLAGILPMGILRSDLKEHFIFLTPIFLYFILLGIGKDKKIILIYLLTLLLGLSKTLILNF